MTEHDSNRDPRSGSCRSPVGKPTHVLLIEDDDGMRDMLAEALRREGWLVTECVNAFPWIQSCVRATLSSRFGEPGHSRSYDVVISDICMPDIGGLDVLRILRQIRCADFSPPTILITAFGDDKTHRKARELGAVTVLDKPFAVMELIAIVRAVT